VKSDHAFQRQFYADCFEVYCYEVRDRKVIESSP